MTRQHSRESWLRVVRQAHDGDPRHLLELLLSPPRTSSQGEPLPDPDTGLCFSPLPDDYGLRLAIVRALAFGPWRKAGVNTVDELMSKTGWGESKPKVADFHIDMVIFALDLHKHDLGDGSPPSMESFADSLGLEVDVLKRRVQARRRARRGTL